MLLFQDIKGVGDFNFNNILLDENSYMEIFWSMTFHTKLLWVQNGCVLGSIK